MIHSFVSFLGIPHALAQTPSFIPSENIPGCDFFSGNIHAACVPLYIAHVIQTIFGFSGGICLLLIVYSGFQYLFNSLPGGSGGTEAKSTLRWALLGFIISSLTFFVIDFIIGTLAGT
ncbi:MAG: hypothetical protein WCG83_05230 [Candidatus Peregrinibacteria bacterium]